MNDREKIIEIIKRNGTYNGRSLSFDYYVVQTDDLADALIAAGIGDVKELQLDKKAYEAASNHYRILFEEAERRAEVAEKALSWLCDETMHNIQIIVYPNTGKQVRDKQELYDYCIKQAEKELQGEGKE